VFAGILGLKEIVWRDIAAGYLEYLGQHQALREPVKGLVPMHRLTRDADQLTEIVVGNSLNLEVVGELHGEQSVTDLVTRQPICHQFGYLAASPIR